MKIRMEKDTYLGLSVSLTRKKTALSRVFSLV
jgi:hypothetical protein